MFEKMFLVITVYFISELYCVSSNIKKYNKKFAIDIIRMIRYIFDKPTNLVGNALEGENEFSFQRKIYIF